MSRLFPRRSTFGGLLRLLFVLVFVVGSFAAAVPAGAAPGGQGKGNPKISLGPVAQQAKPIKPAGKIAKPPTVKQVDPKLAKVNATDPIDLKVLVIGVTGDDLDRAAITGALQQLGTPYTFFDASVQTLTSSTLWDGALHGYYQGIVLTRGDLGYCVTADCSVYQSGFTSDEWAALQDYENRFAIRQVTLETSPVYGGGSPFDYGLAEIGYGPITASLTAAGMTSYSYLNSSSQITFDRNAYYSIVVDTANVTPLLTAPCGTSQTCALASIVNYPGTARQNLTMTFPQNSGYLPSTLLSYGVVNWVTKGLFLGERHVNMDYHVDDLLIADDVWDTALLMDTGNTNYKLSGGQLAEYRITGNDFNSLIKWQNAARAMAASQGGKLASTLRLEFAFNGWGASSGAYAGDTLTSAVRSGQANFGWINHTYDHTNMSCTDPDQFGNCPTPLSRLSYNTAYNELSRNNTFATRTIRFTNYQKDAFVQPDISGLDNPNFLRAATNFGLRTLISDTSRSGGNNLKPNEGIKLAGYSQLLVIPRHPTNLFYNLITPDQWVSEFNCYYSSEPSQLQAREDACTMHLANNTTQNRLGTLYGIYNDVDYNWILDSESNWLLSYLINWDLDPVMFHEANLAAYPSTTAYPNSEGNSLLGDLIDKTLAKYYQYYNLPIRNLSQHDVGLRMTDRMAYDASGATASLVPCATGATSTKLTVKTAKAATIPVTGNVTYGYTSRESYGGQWISSVTLKAGATKVLTVACPVN